MNVRSTVHLAKRVLQDMVPRNSGRLLFTSPVAARMPGPADTNFSERAGIDDTKPGVMEDKDDPRDVARDGFLAMMAGENQVVPGHGGTSATSRRLNQA